MSQMMLETMRRAQTGPYCKERDFDMKILFPKLMELLKEHEIKSDPNEFVPSDNSLAKDVFDAGLELFLHAGVYCKDTSRIIQFNKDEVETALKKAPKKLTLGEGTDACILRKRGLDDKAPLIIRGGPPGSPVSEGDIYVKSLMSYIKEPSLDIFATGTLQSVKGVGVRAGLPTEILASRYEGAWAREAANRCNRPGVHISGVASSATSRGTIAACNPENGFRPSDGSIIPILAELKTGYESLCKVIHAKEYGMIVVQLTCPLVGGLGGWAEGLAVLSVASHLAGLLVNQAHYYLQGHLDLNHADNIDQKGIWISSVVGQSMTLKTDLLVLDDYFCRAGPCTNELLYQVAAKSVLSPCSGYSSVGSIGSTGNSMTDHNTGLEAKLMSEVINAALGLKRNDANELVKSLYKKYKKTLDKPPMGKRFQECYDLKSVEPSAEWQTIYKNVKKEITNLGLKMD